MTNFVAPKTGTSWQVTGAFYGLCGTDSIGCLKHFTQQKYISEI